MNHRWLTFTLLSLLFSNPPSAQCAASENAPVESVPGDLMVAGAPAGSIVVRYYDVIGGTAEELRTEIKTKGPVDGSGIPRDAYAGWRLTWHWPKDSAGRPDFTQTEVRCTGEVTLPRWIPHSDADPSLTAEWHRYLSAMMRHERGHLEHCFEMRAKLVSALIEAARGDPALSAEGARKITRRFLKEIRRLDSEFDRETDHGRREGVTLRDAVTPPPGGPQ